MANNWQLGMLAGLDSQSRNQLNQDIKTIQKTLNSVELKATLNPNLIKSLENQLSKLQVSLTDVNIPKSVLDGLVSQINNALSGIQIPNISLGGQTANQARQAGQQIGNIVSDEVNNALGKVTSKEISIGFTVEKTASDEFNNAVDEEIRKLQQANNKLNSVRYMTNTERQEVTDIFGNVDYEHVEKLTGAVFRYNTETGEAITKTMKWAQIGMTVDDKGNDIPLMGWVQGLTTYNKSLDESSVKTDTFVDKQKTAVTNLRNQLATIESKFNSSKKPLSDVYDIAQVENKIFDVRKAIDALSTSSKSGFTDAKNAVSTEITELNNLITTLQNAEYAATSLRTKDIKTVKADEENNLNAFVEKMKQSGHYTDKLEQDVASLRKQLNGVFDASTLTTYLNGLSNLQSEFKAVDAAAKTVEKATKIQTNVEAEKKILTLYKNELKEAGVLTGDVKKKIQDMFHSLSKVDSQNGLTTWRAELKGVKAETDAVLKSVQSSSVKEQDAYEVAYKELKKLYDLKIEYAKLGSNKETDFYYGKAIADQEKVWRQAWSKTSEPDNWNVQKRNELHREELVLQDKLAQAYGKTANARKQAEEVNKIQLLSNGGVKNDYATQIATLEGQFRSLGLAQDTTSVKTQGVKDSLATLRAEFAKPVEERSFQVIETANNNLQRELIESTNEFKQLQASMKGMATEQQRLSLANTIEAWNQKNTKATREVREQNDRYVASLRDLGTAMTKLDFNKINTGFKQNENSMRTLHKLGASLKDQLKQAASSFTQWVSVSSAIMAVIYQLQKMPQKVKELDDAITDFTMATGANKAQISELTEVYSKLGDELSATVTDVTVSATEWLKQGKSIEEAEILIRDAMVLSKVGQLSSADATKYLTSAMKGYKVATEDVLGVVDKLSAVDMASATDVGGLAEGMSQVASSADLAGVSMDKLLGYLATIGEVTQSGMSEVGTTLNAVFARMGNIKLSRLKDYDNNGEDLSNVETVLRGVNISLRDSSNSFRDFDEVLDETASRWDTFSEVQQRAIASAFAGTHHLNSFIVLMENYDTALKYTETSLNSSGQAMEKFGAYEDSLTGRLERMENAFIGLSNTVLESDFLKGLIDIGTSGIKVLDGFIDGIKEINSLGGLLDSSLGGTLGAIGGLIMNKNGIGERTKFQWRIVLRPLF